MATKPIIVLVHRSFRTSAVYDDVSATLSSHRYSSIAVQNPTSAGIDKTPTNLTTADDTAAVRSALRQLVSEGKEVVLVCQSYGGIVGSSAADGFEQSSIGQPGIKAGLFIASFLVPAGKSAADLFADAGIGAGMPPGITIVPDYPEFMMENGLDQSSYDDVPEDLVKPMLEHVRPQLLSVFGSKAESNGWDYEPCWNLTFVGEKAVPAPITEPMFHNASQNSKYSWRTEQIESSHSGRQFKKMPAHDKVLEVVHKVAGEFM